MVGFRVELRDHLRIDGRVGEIVGMMKIQLLLLIDTFMFISRRKGNVVVGLRVKLRAVLMDWVQRPVLIDTGLFNGIAMAGFCKQLGWLLRETWLISGIASVACCK